MSGRYTWKCVKAFEGNHSDTITRQWLVYKKSQEEEINVKLPDVYLVRFKSNDRDFNEKYSDKGEIIEKNGVINYSVLPGKASDLLKKGEYKDWDVSGDVLELLDNLTGETIGYMVNVEKADQKERLIFKPSGEIGKIQKIS